MIGTRVDVRTDTTLVRIFSDGQLVKVPRHQRIVQVNGASIGSSVREGNRMDLGLSGKSVVITGGSRGIGRACAELFAAEGANVGLIARDQSHLERASRQLSDAFDVRVLTRSADMGISQDVEDAVAEIIETLGGIDILVTCAGSAPAGQADSIGDDDWLDALKIKSLGYLRSIRAVTPHMQARGRGAIVMVVGNNGTKPSHWEIVGGAANAADLNIASALAEQYGEAGIRINTVNPGPVNTGRWQQLESAFAHERGLSQEVARQIHLDSIPLGRLCEPEEVASLVVFLASDRAAYINGAHVPIDGGQRKAIIDLLSGQAPTPSSGP